MSTTSRAALAPEQIRVNAIHPTNCNTDMLHSPPMYRAFRPDLQNPTREDAELVFPVIQGMPIPYVEPEDISEAVLFLASDAARYVTGQQLRVDAGGFLKVKPWSGVEREGEASMPKGIMYVETMPVSPDREADYHKWYNDTHLAQILRSTGSCPPAGSPRPTGNGPFIAIYELDCDDLDAAVQRLRELGASGKMTGLENLAMDPKPIPHVYREIGSYEP